MICGDHICINKAEAKQYFEENLSLEVQIIEKKKNKQIDLVELNLNENSIKRQVSIKKKDRINKDLKVLSKKQIKNIKKDVKKKQKRLRSVKKDKIKSNNKKTKSKPKIENLKSIEKKKKTLSYNVVDVCTLIKDCNIDEISKYLLRESKKKSFPDITSKQ